MRVVSQVWHIGTFLKMYIELGKCIEIENGHLLHVPKLPVSYVHIHVFYSKKNQLSVSRRQNLFQTTDNSK